MAHPHVFTDTAVEVIFDAAGQVTALRVTWTYDDLFSLMTVEERGADTDGDGSVSADEFAPLAGFDSNWPEDYDGDTYILSGGAPVALDPTPTGWEDGWSDGRLWSRHTRTLTAPLDPAKAEVVIQSYDPGYYVAYAIDPRVAFTGRDDCRAEVFVPDLDAAAAELQASLKEYAPGDNLDDFGLGDVGAGFAEEIRLTCGR
ncbi:MAG: hypothetical protein RLZZ528_704 [Pseudomonadota bacterium]